MTFYDIISIAAICAAFGMITYTHFSDIKVQRKIEKDMEKWL